MRPHRTGVVRRAGWRGPCVLVLLSIAAPWIGPSAAGAQDLTVAGCDERLPGEVGVGALTGSVGSFVSVPVTVHAVGDIQALTLSVDLPPGVLAYVRTERGPLTQSWEMLDGFHFAATNQVRIVGLTDAGLPITSGTVGVLARIVLEVTATGSGEFGTSDLRDHLSGYVSCEDVHGSTPVEPLLFGRIKAAYR